jgi:hypothetical protein
MRVYDINHYLFEIEKQENTTMKITWYWEIKIARNNDKYMGMAIERNRGKQIPWVELKSLNLTEEMKEICKNHMR